MENISKAIINVMKAVKGIDKSMTVGTGNSSYKGVADKDVKQIIGKAMEENGLCMLPVGVEPKVTVERWIEETSYGPKSKQSVFTEVKTKYLLLHESGESIEIEGYGQGVDSQDKGAGKATTYALKYAMLYAFMVPTGKIEDADNDHSDNKEVPPVKKAKQPITDEKVLKEIDAFDNIDQFIDFRTKYLLTATQKIVVTNKFNELFPNHQKTA